MGQERKILVVDDNEAVCALLSKLLGDKGYLVTTVVDGASAFQALALNEYQLILLDLILPDTSGIEILRRIRQEERPTDIVMMTSNASIETALEAMRLGAQDYLLKPFKDLDMVLRVVQKTMEKRLLIAENDRLYSELREEKQKLELAVNRLALLNAIGHALHSILNVKDLLHMLVKLVADELIAQRVSLMLIDKETQELTIESAVGFDKGLIHDIRVPVGMGVAGWVAKEGQAVIVEDINDDPRFAKQHKRPYTSDSFICAPLVLCVPIMLKQEVIGVINVNNKTQGGVFSEDDLQFVATLASQASLAIANARAFEQLRETNQNLQREIGEKTRAEDKVKELNAQLEERVAERTAEMETAYQELEAYDYSLSHDLRAPLSRIIGFSKAVLEDFAEQLDPEAADYVGRIYDSGRQMFQLTDAVLKMSQLIHDQLLRETVDLSAMARSIGDELVAGEPVRQVEIVIVPGLTAWGDSRLLRMVLQNLLSNALKFTAKKERARIEFGARRSAATTVYYLRDNGAGFDMAYADLLFKGFERLHSNDEFPGIGIGLASVQRIVKRHGGSVWGEGEVGLGATIYFTLKGDMEHDKKEHPSH